MIIAAIFIILFAFIYAALKEMAIFGRNTRVILAGSVSLLCIVSLFQLFDTGQGVGGTMNQPIAGTVNGPGEEATEKDDEQDIWIPVLLLPYAALALTLLLLPLLLLLSAVRKGRCWQRIVCACRKLAAVKPDIEQENLQTLNSNQLSRRPRNGKAQIKSTRKDIHV